MIKFVLDAYAWIEYLEGSEKGNKVSYIIEDENNQNFTCGATVAEIISKFLNADKDINIALTAINRLSNIINVDIELGILAGQIHFETKNKNKNFGMLDAFVAATAKKVNAKILTGDPDFKGFKNAVLI